MNAKQIKEASEAGNSNFEVLQMVIDSGFEFPDAVNRVAAALRMKVDEIAEMELDYDECC